MARIPLALLLVASIGCATSEGTPPADLAQRRRDYLGQHPGSELARNIAVSFHLDVRLHSPANHPQWAAVLVDGELMTTASVLLNAGQHELEVLLGYPPPGPDGRLRLVSARQTVTVTMQGAQGADTLLDVSATSGELQARFEPPIKVSGPPLSVRRLESSRLQLSTVTDSDRRSRFVTVLALCSADGAVDAVVFPFHENPGNAGRLLGAVTSWRYQPPAGTAAPFEVLDVFARERR